MNTISKTEVCQNGFQASSISEIKDKIQMIVNCFDQMQRSPEDDGQTAENLFQLRDKGSSIAMTVVHDLDIFEKAEILASTQITKLENEIEKCQESTNVLGAKLKTLNSYLEDVENENLYLRNQMEEVYQELYNKEAFRGEVEKELNDIIKKLGEQNQELKTQVYHIEREHSLNRFNNSNGFDDVNGANSINFGNSYVKTKLPLNETRFEKKQKELEASLDRLRKHLRMMHEENMRSLLRAKARNPNRARFSSLPSSLEAWAEQSNAGIRTSSQNLRIHRKSFGDTNGANKAVMRNMYAVRNEKKQSLSKRDSKSYLYELDHEKPMETKPQKKQENWKGEQKLLDMLNKRQKSQSTELGKSRNELMMKGPNRRSLILLEEAGEKIQQLGSRRRFSKEEEATRPEVDLNLLAEENNLKERNQPLEISDLTKQTNNKESQHGKNKERAEGSNNHEQATNSNNAISKGRNQISKKKERNPDNFGLISALFLFIIFFFLKLGFSTLSMFSRVVFPSGKKKSVT